MLTLDRNRYFICPNPHCGYKGPPYRKRSAILLAAGGLLLGVAFIVAVLAMAGKLLPGDMLLAAKVCGPLVILLLIGSITDGGHVCPRCRNKLRL